MPSLLLPRRRLLPLAPLLLLIVRCCEGLLPPTPVRSGRPQFASSSPIHHHHRRRQSPHIYPRKALRASLVSGDDCWSMWGALSVAAAAGAKIGETKFGTFMSPPVCSMAITFLLSNVGVLPGGGESPHVAATQKLCVRMATPLLLYSADMRRVAAASGRLFPAFLLGTLASTAGAIIGKAATLRGLCAASSDGAKLAAALCAKNIGGGLNYVGECLLSAPREHPFLNVRADRASEHSAVGLPSRSLSFHLPSSSSSLPLSSLLGLTNEQTNERTNE